jgi:2'-5' RNA ligase
MSLLNWYKLAKVKEGANPEYSWIAVFLPEELSKKIVSFAKETIDEKDLFLSDDPDDTNEYGIEAESHVTIKYGITTDNKERVLRLYKDEKGGSAKMVSLSLFKNERYDVLKFDIESKDLKRLNKIASKKIENEDKYPTYHAHCTVAYLKPDCGSKYLSFKEFDDKEFDFSEIIFRDRKGKTTKIPLS